MITFSHGEDCYRVFPPTKTYPDGDIVKHKYHEGLEIDNYLGLLFKTRQDAEIVRKQKVKSYNAKGSVIKIPNTKRIEMLVELIAETSQDVEIHTICREILYEIDMAKSNERDKWFNGVQDMTTKRIISGW